MDAKFIIMLVTLPKLVSSYIYYKMKEFWILIFDVTKKLTFYEA